MAQAGTITIAAMNPVPNAGQGITRTITVAASDPTSQIKNTTPAYFVAGGVTQSATLTGSGFTANTTVTGSNATSTSLVITAQTATTLTVTVPSALLATAGNSGFVATNPGSAGTASLYANVFAAPTIATFTPTTATTGQAFTLQLNGTGYFQRPYAVTVRFGSTDLQITSASSTQPNADVPPSLVPSAGTVPVYVYLARHQAESWGTSSIVNLAVQ